MRRRRWTGKYIGKNLLSQRNKDFAKLQNLFPSTEIASTDLFFTKHCNNLENCSQGRFNSAALFPTSFNIFYVFVISALVKSLSFRLVRLKQRRVYTAFHLKRRSAVNTFAVACSNDLFWHSNMRICLKRTACTLLRVILPLTQLWSPWKKVKYFTF